MHPLPVATGGYPSKPHANTFFASRQRPHLLRLTATTLGSPSTPLSHWRCTYYYRLISNRALSAQADGSYFAITDPREKIFRQILFSNSQLARTCQIHVRHHTGVRICARGLSATARTTSMRPNEHIRATTNVEVTFSDMSVTLTVLHPHAEPQTQTPSHHLLDRFGRPCRITAPPPLSRDETESHRVLLSSPHFRGLANEQA
jgi:hypothetical protein